MQLPLEITFRNMDPSPAVQANVRDRVAKLEQFYDRIVACRVAIEAPHKHHHKGRLYHVRVDITVPDGELVASRRPEDNHAHEDVYVAVRDACQAAERQLKAYAERRRREVKSHEAPAHGRVRELFPQMEYGEIETADGRHVYFHRNSVLNGDFAHLEAGAEVRFVEEEGERGPQASTVKVVGKHHVAG